MGNNKSSTKLDVLRQSKPGQWIKEGTSGYCDIVRNSQNGLLAEQYSIAMDSRLSQEENINRYQYRSTSNQYIVEVYQVEKENSQYICQGQDFIKVRTERIPQRLSELGKVTAQEGLYILSQALNGFKIIYQLHGMAQVNDDMIGLTPDGRVKIWLNENFAKNLPDSQARTIHQNEMVMVDQISDIVRQHIHGGSFPLRYKDILAQNPSNTFDQALNQLNTYLETSRTVLPKAIRSVRLQQPTQIVRPSQSPPVTIQRAQTVYSKQTAPLTSQPNKPSITINVLYNPTKALNSTPTNQSINVQQQSQVIQKTSNTLPAKTLVRHVGQPQKANQANIPSYYTGSSGSRVVQPDEYMANSQTGSTSAKLSHSGHYNAQSLSQVRRQVHIPTAKIESPKTSFKQTSPYQPQLRIRQIGKRQVTLSPFKQQSQTPVSEATTLQTNNAFTTQVEHLKEMNKMVNVKSEPNIRSENLMGSQPVSFVSPPTETKHIKFEQQPIKEKEKIFVRANNLATPPSKATFQRKQMVMAPRQTQTKPYLTGATSIPQNVNYIKSVRSPDKIQSDRINTIDQQKYIPGHIQSQSNSNKWTAPRQVTTMEAVQVNSTNKQTAKTYQLTTKRPDNLRANSSAHTGLQKKNETPRLNQQPQKLASGIQPSEVEQLDALQNRLNEIVNKTRALASTNQRMEQLESRSVKQAR